MSTEINPPALSTLLSAWLRGVISVALGIGLTWLIWSHLLGDSAVGPILVALGLFTALWTVLTVVQAAFEHTVTITNDAIVVRTWGGALLGRPGRVFPTQRPLLTRGRPAGRPGGGLRGTRMTLVDAAGRRHRFSFVLMRFNALASALETSRVPS